MYRPFHGETHKAYPRRLREDFFEKYCLGEGIDIGFGGDLVSPTACGWDKEDGDATYMYGIPDNYFDFVYASHCLEHLSEPGVALSNWLRIAKPGGYLIIVVPHRDLYEKKRELPSRWNNDHKHFYLPDRDEPPHTLGLQPLIERSLAGFRIEYIKTCSEGHTNNDPLTHSDGEYSIEAVLQKGP